MVCSVLASIVEPSRGRRIDLFTHFFADPAVNEEKLVEQLGGLLFGRGVDRARVLRRHVAAGLGRSVDPVVQHFVHGATQALE